MTGKKPTERERLESLKLDPIQIAFGDIFLSSEDGRTRYIIVNVGQGNTFSSIEMGESDEDWIAPLTGTSKREYIEKIVDHWTFEKIERALRAHAAIPPKYDIEPFLRKLHKNSKQSRMLG